MSDNLISLPTSFRRFFCFISRPCLSREGDGERKSGLSSLSEAGFWGCATEIPPASWFLRAFGRLSGGSGYRWKCGASQPVEGVFSMAQRKPSKLKNASHFLHYSSLQMQVQYYMNHLAMGRRDLSCSFVCGCFMKRNRGGRHGEDQVGRVIRRSSLPKQSGPFQGGRPTSLARRGRSAVTNRAGVDEDLRRKGHNYKGLPGRCPGSPFPATVFPKSGLFPRAGPVS